MPSTKRQRTGGWRDGSAVKTQNIRLVLSTYIRKLTNACNPSFRKSNIIFCLLRYLHACGTHTYTHTHTHTHKISILLISIIKSKILSWLIEINCGETIIDKYFYSYMFILHIFGYIDRVPLIQSAKDQMLFWLQILEYLYMHNKIFWGWSKHDIFCFIYTLYALTESNFI